MENSEITQLRQLLLNLDRGELDKLKKLLNYPNDLALEIAKVLPEAVLFSIHDSERLSTALIPMIETVITRSVAQNPRLLADALYPVIGRSIRKSINEEFKKLLQTFNELIENTFSSQALKWRYQSLVTGRKYSEIVISNTIKYKAEHVFLIHRETGLLLCEVHDEMSHSADSDSISGMLKAITDFVHDSFEDTGNSELNLIEMEGYQVLIEQGPHAIIASLVKGFTLDEYRQILQDTLEQIHDDYSASFQSFNGDTFIFETSRDLLIRCLKTEKKEEFNTNKSRIGIFVALPIFMVLLFFVGRTLYFNWQWSKYINLLKQSELVLLSQHGKSKRTYYVHGMILPGAKHPDSLLAGYNFPKDHFERSWHLYLQGNGKVIETYIAENFGIPATINLHVNKDSIFINGKTNELWYKKFQEFLKSNLSWYSLNGAHLNLITTEKLQAKMDAFNRLHLFFELGEVKFTAQSSSEISNFAQELKAIISDAETMDAQVFINVNGYADQFGDRNYNQILSDKRATFVKIQLEQLGVPDSIISVKGMGIWDKDDQLSSEERRRVNFKVEIKPNTHD